MIATIPALIIGLIMLLVGDAVTSRRIAARTGERPEPNDRVIAAGSGMAAMLCALGALLVPGLVIGDHLWTTTLFQLVILSETAFDPTLDLGTALQVSVPLIWLLTIAAWAGMLFGHWMARRRLTGGKLSIVLPRWVIGMAASVGAAALVTMLLITALFTIGGVVTTIREQNQTTHYESPPITETLSREAREGCIALGMEPEEIRNDQDACLVLYWTPERLKQSERTYLDWWADNDEEYTCEVKGRMNNSSYACEMMGGDFGPAGLPASEDNVYDERDPWWDAQPTRDPGRTSSPLNENGKPNTPTMPWYSRG